MIWVGQREVDASRYGWIDVVGWGYQDHGHTRFMEVVFLCHVEADGGR